jgi:hypothetical protein
MWHADVLFPICPFETLEKDRRPNLEKASQSGGSKTSRNLGSVLEALGFLWSELYAWTTPW